MKGSKEPEKPTDKQCPHCERWFSNRGITAHKQYCEEKVNKVKTMTEENQETEGQKNQEENNEENTEEICPECGNHGDGNEPHIYLTDQNLMEYLKNNRLWEANEGKFIENDYLCFGCKTFFSEGEE